MEKSSINCPSCGTPITFEGDLESLECLVCGENIDVASSKALTEKLTSPSISVEQGVETTRKTTPLSPSNNALDSASPSAKATGHKKTIIIAASCAIALITACSIIFLSLSGLKSSKKSTDVNLLESPEKPSLVVEEKVSTTNSNTPKNTNSKLSSPVISVMNDKKSGDTASQNKDSNPLNTPKTPQKEVIVNNEDNENTASGKDKTLPQNNQTDVIVT